LFFWLSFAIICVAVLLATVSVFYDDLTNFTGCDSHTPICGWQEFHNKTETLILQKNDGQFTWSQYCTDSKTDHLDGTPFCDLEKIGKAWIGLMFLGIFFGLLSATLFIVDAACCTSHTWVLGSGTLFTLFVTLAFIVWASGNKCINGAETAGAGHSCHSSLGTSWALAFVAAFLGLASHVTYKWWK